MFSEVDNVALPRIHLYLPFFDPALAQMLRDRLFNGFNVFLHFVQRFIGILELVHQECHWTGT